MLIGGQKDFSKSTDSQHLRVLADMVILLKLGDSLLTETLPGGNELFILASIFYGWSL